MQEFYWGVENDFTTPISVGMGTSIVVSGWFYHKIKKTKKIEIIAGNNSFQAMSINSARFDVLQLQASKGISDLENSLNSGFWAIVRLPEIDGDCDIHFTLKATLKDNEVCFVDLGTVKLTTSITNPIPLNQLPNADQPLVTICMATYNPRMDLFKRQIDSILNQTYENWICIICDDNSSDVIVQEIQNVIKDDPRFFLIRNTENKGFYYNFERCLTYVPKETAYVALSDQDDYWHPNKLEELIRAFDKDTSLVYSDMNLVDGNGNILSHTYWTNRRNNYTDLEFLLLANTVTGAASMFKAELLPKILPFPQRIGDSFHDWWIALCALMESNIKYVNKPLYDYCQHGNNVIGHAGKKSLLKEIWKIKKVIKRGPKFFHFDYKRLVLKSTILLQRFNGRDKRKLGCIEKFTRIRSLLFLFWLVMKGIILRRDTLHAELRLFVGLAANRTLNTICWLFRKKYARSAKIKISIQGAVKKDLTL